MVWPVSKAKIHSGLLSKASTAKTKTLTVSVPQGSCAGANIFNLYCSSLQEVVPEDLQLSGFADDHSVRKTFKASNRLDEENTKTKLQECLISIKKWMDETRLKMSPSKTEFIYFVMLNNSKSALQTLSTWKGDLIVRSEGHQIPRSLAQLNT